MVYLINSYDIIDAEEFSQYPPRVRSILQRFGARVLASDTKAISLEGKSKTMNAIIEFPSEEVARTCYNDPEYQEVKNIRHRSTTNTSMVIVREFRV